MNISSNTGSKTLREDGNVLFLILIAVALFAALSYAVTSSTRSSGGNTSGETDLISSAQITQYPAAVSTAIVRMVITGTGIDEIRFNRPSEFTDLDVDDLGVFHPSGGGATYIPAPADIMVSGSAGQWVFNAELEVPDISLAGVDGNDIIAYLIGVKRSICTRINREHGLGASIPVLNADRSGDYGDRMYDDGTTDYVMPVIDVPDIDDGSGRFDGQPFGCFQNSGGGDYVYYHVVVER
ncbi:MAG: hypothetical protein COA45_05010 [Zetaproteobacteria bacterium]|nr:MAG: hypothetical protein COA45_05010 [Zetaproteobacteria bacterium]